MTSRGCPRSRPSWRGDGATPQGDVSALNGDVGNREVLAAAQSGATLSTVRDIVGVWRSAAVVPVNTTLRAPGYLRLISSECLRRLPR